MNKIYTIITLLFIGISLNSQTVCGPSPIKNCITTNNVQIGNGISTNNNNTYPAIYGNWYKSSRHQLLFLSSELLAAGVLPGKISSIAFNIATISGTNTYPNFSIKMKCTAASNLSLTPMDSIGLSQVYFSATQTITTGWNNHNFQTDYEWDGASNILIDVCNDFTSLYSNNSSIPYTITPFISVRWGVSDITPACAHNYSNSYSPNNTYRPNIMFGNCISTTNINSKITALNSISIYPNPSNGLFTISNTSTTDKFDVVIINSLAQTVMSESVKNNNQLTFDLSKYSKGIYYVKVTTSESTKLFKLILE